MKKNIGLYIHMPFCRAKCYYCDFVSFVGKEKIAGSYIDAVLKEIEYIDLTKYNYDTIYIGGGTPSILDSKYVKIILDKIKSHTEKQAEITIEINPGTADKQKLQEYKDIGINRISIGLQSTDNTLLKQIRKNT